MANDEKKGLGGWLILVGIGIVLNPVRILYNQLPIYVPIFTDGIWEALTDENSEVYHPLWQPLLTIELAFNIAIFAASIYLIYLYFTKHHRFPLTYIALLAASFVFIPLDAWACSFVLPNEAIFDTQTTREMVRTTIACLIWIPYMLISERVKATFVEHRPLPVPRDPVQSQPAVALGETGND